MSELELNGTSEADRSNPHTDSCPHHPDCGRWTREDAACDCIGRCECGRRVACVHSRHLAVNDDDVPRAPSANEDEDNVWLWFVGTCVDCGGGLYATDVRGLTLPMQGQRHGWCREMIVEVLALREDRVGRDGCRLQVGDRITLAHADLHPEAITTESPARK